MATPTVLQRLVGLQLHQRCIRTRTNTLSSNSSVTAAATGAIRMEIAARAFTTSTKDWSDFNAVVKALRQIANEQGLQSSAATSNEAATEQMPDTKLLKELGHHELVRAIRKHHGGFVGVSARLGVAPDANAFEIHKQKTSRANRRAKRNMRLAKHDYH